MKATARHSVTVALAGVFLAAAGEVHACPMCMGGADAANGPALNGAIFFMLGCLGVMFAGIGAVAYGIWRRRGQQTPVA
jgi:hypothetical protein